MEPVKGMICVVATAILIGQTVAFLPNRIGISLPSTDYTLTDLTVEGIVRAVARYFEDSNPDRYDPGDLTELKPLTPSSLYQAHYGSCVYSTQFELAISAITDENARISRDKATKALWHFNGNRINKGNTKAVGVRKTLLGVLEVGDVDSPDYDAARLYCGQFLHLAQSFYSNTNWVELHRWLSSQIGDDEDTIVVSPELGIVDPLAWRQSPGSEDMCQNCPLIDDVNIVYDCTTTKNLRQFVYYLTSGYKSGQDQTKPASSDPIWGKCSHGGTSDKSRLEVALGGINKETSDPVLSPHYDLHEQAALTALKATEDFFYESETGLYALIGEQKFRKLLNLDIVGTSLSFVIDVSGSMSDDIIAVREETIDIVNLFNDTCLAPSRYVVAPFNDPDVGPVLVTKDPQECIDFISNLTASGGGDCPELANAGLELGLQNSFDGSTVYLFTDADDKDKDKLPDVLALIEEKQIKVQFLLTGSCPTLRRRRKRVAGTAAISSSYETIAAASGGDIYLTDKAGIGDLTGIIEGELKASQATLLKTTILNRENYTVTIPVDSTTLEALVSVSGALGTAAINVTNPAGMILEPGEQGGYIYVDSKDQLVFGINGTAENAAGMWVLAFESLDSSTEYDVTVTANTPINFQYNILEVDATSGLAYSLDGSPIAGSEVIIEIQLTAPEFVSTVGFVNFHNSGGDQTLLNAPAEQALGRSDGVYTATITVPDQPFFVSITGQDIDDQEFIRTQPSVVQVVDLKLARLPETDTLDDLFPGGYGNFTFRVTNSGPDDFVNINIAFDTSFAVAAAAEPIVDVTVLPFNMTLATGESGEGLVNVFASEDTPVGTTITVTLTIASTLTSVRNIISVGATVFAFQNSSETFDLDANDNTPPTCVLEEVSGCTAEQMGADCYLHDWQLRFTMSDENILIGFDLDPPAETSGSSLLTEEFSLTDITTLYSASCCCPKLNITVSDGGGNTATCSQDYYSPVAGDIKEPVCLPEYTTVGITEPVDPGTPRPPVSVDPSLSTGAIVGIALGAAAGVIIGVALIVMIAKSFGTSKSLVVPIDEKVPYDPGQDNVRVES